MSYTSLDDEDYQNFRADLLKRKEFASLKLPQTSIVDPVDESIQGTFLQSRSYQQFVANYSNPNTKADRLLLYQMTGVGKCHGKDTAILMYDRSKKMVQDVVVGDLLMGDDEKPRTVLSIARGREQMIEIRPTMSNLKFSCNRSHILSVVRECYKICPTSQQKIKYHTIIDCNYRDLQPNDKLYRRPLRENNAPELNGFTKISNQLNKLLQNRITFYDKNCFTTLLNPEDSSDEIVNSILSTGTIAHCVGTTLTCWKPEPICLEDGSFVIPEPFQLTELPENDYYGFSIDGNHRYLLGNYIVTHNTLAACEMGMGYASAYKKMYAMATTKIPAIRANYAQLDQMTPNIYILGFEGTRGAFRRELLKYTEFGFVTKEELDKKAFLQKNAMSGIPSDIDALKDFMSKLKRRLHNKSKGGFFKFVGYDELALKLFKSDTIKLVDLEKESLSKNVNFEDLVDQKIQSGELTVNETFLQSFFYSFVIGDELHQTYNMESKNSRGVALQYILNKAEGVIFLGLTATPMNSSPTEIVNIINYLSTNGVKIRKSDLFAGGQLLPNSLEKIGTLIRGKVSFLQDSDPQYYPSKNYVGEFLSLPSTEHELKSHDVFPYLKFTECKMSKFHQDTLSAYLSSDDTVVDNDVEQNVNSPLTNDEVSLHTTVVTDEQLEKATKTTIPTDGYAIIDMVAPNPDSDTVGLFRSRNVMTSINGASQKFKDAVGIRVKKMAGGMQVLTGAFLRRENIGKYSAKYEKLIDTVHAIIKFCGENVQKCRKTFIYHDRVTGSGALQIAELFMENGFLDESSSYSMNTICMICGETMQLHPVNERDVPVLRSHNFMPVRFMTIHSYMDRSRMEELLTKYNDPNNCNGHNFMLLVGTKIISESYDFKDVQELIYTSMPINFATFIQVEGRTIRNGSHLNLPRDQWIVHIRILLTTVDTANNFVDPISPELHRYISKMSQYLTIQLVERELSRNAIDAYTNRDIIMSDNVWGKFFGVSKNLSVEVSESQAKKTMGMLYYDIPKLPESEITSITFMSTGLHIKEISDMIYVIKRLFMKSPVWTYDDLWSSVRNPKIKLQVNPAMFSENNFIIALSKMIDISEYFLDAMSMVDRWMDGWLTDSEFLYIVLNGIRHKIVQRDKFYIAFPIDQSYRPIVDIESYIRSPQNKAKIRIDVGKYVENVKLVANFQTKRDEFAKTFATKDLTIDILFDYSAQFQSFLLEESIVDLLLDRGSKLDKRLLQFYHDFRILIHKSEIVKYAEVLKQFSSNLSKLSNETVLGYTTSKSCKLYDLSISKWFNVSKIALNRQIKYKETGPIIGYLESTPIKTKFKLRKPAQVIRETSMAMTTKSKEESSNSKRILRIDQRFLENGIVCNTKNKRELLFILASLGVSTSSMTKSQIKTKNLCREIVSELIALEKKERDKDSRYKYFYGWWDERIEITLTI